MTDGTDRTATTDGDRIATAGPVTATYAETDAERVLEFRLETGEDRESTADAGDGPPAAAVAQNREGYAMLSVRGPGGDERERYYGFEMALDHVAELLGVAPRELPVPDAAADMGM